MKNEIKSLVVCLLMITTVFSVVGFPAQAEEVKNFYSTQPNYQAPTPGYAPLPPTDTIMDKLTVREHSEKTAASMNDIIISLLEQVDEVTYMRHLENLTSLGPHFTGSEACQAAAEYIYNQFNSTGLPTRYQHWKVGSYEGDNVEATINGTDESSNEIYIICAHYDTVSASPGADDDSSGTVAVLMAASIMSQQHLQFNHTIKFVAFSGEEQGLLGSRFYAVNASNQHWNIIGVLNADMISYAITTKDGNNLIVFANDASEWLYNYTVDISTEYADYIHLNLYNGGPTWGSDHYYFWDEGYDALFYFEYTETPYYHTSGDSIVHINVTYALKNVRLIFATLLDLSEVSIRNFPPANPIITGPEKGSINQWYNFSFVTTDPEGEDVYYYIDWGDGQVEEWVGPYTSGQPAEFLHLWNVKGTYTIKAKAKDINGIESDWGTRIVPMPKNYSFSLYELIQTLLLRFSNRFPFLQYIIHY